MNFDFGEVLSRAIQIAWKHKVLWLFNALPVLLSFLIFPVVFVPIFFTDFGTRSDPSFLENPLYIFFFVSFSILVSVASMIVYSISSSSVTLGVVRGDGGSEKLQFAELLNDGKPYWWRMLGVMLLIGVGISLVFLTIFGCISIFGAVTAGIGFICVQPLFLLLYPLMMVLYGFVEESQAAVVVDDLGVIDAVQRGWELVRANFWRIVLISLVVYFGISILSGVIMLPLMLPFFFLPFFMEGGQTIMTPRTMMLFMGGFSLIFLPIMALLQGITITFLKSTYALVYLRLTKSQDKPSIALEPNA